MATTSKLSFRARNLDANKGMCVFFAAELPDLSECAPIARAVAQMPTGMEKEEEMESHLQDAILAQQASTSGVRVDNHVIPTPKVFPVEQKRYDEVYPVQPPPPKNNLIKVQAWLALDKEEAEYDVDSDDEAWLAGKPHIDPRALERIFDTLETKSSDNNICLPDSAKSALSGFDDATVDDVYDYWLHKRAQGPALRFQQLGVGGLIPRVRTECRKDQQGGVNPYVAFRRRAEKMQTRKNRKNDEDSYEKVLKLGHDLRKTVTLFDMVKRREKTKIALIDLDSEILAHRMGLLDFGSNIYNQFLAKIRDSSKLAASGVTNGITKAEDDVLKKKPKRRRIRTVTGSLDREVPSKAWLKKNAEVWNRPPSVFATSGVSPVAEVDQSTASEDNDGLSEPVFILGWIKAIRVVDDFPHETAMLKRTVSGDDSNPMPTPNISSDPPVIQSGNGLAGRVDPSTPISTKEYGAVPTSDEWREASGSPSESNSSSDWVTPSLASQIYPMLSSEEEARTGDHPIAKQPPVNVKGSVVGATEIEYRSPFLLAPPTVGS
ncbi:unnamed protein product [Nippostrongylus brasiliensis]|uniref:Enhancer of polycomb-like protein n=1 Tax=Nippostrongylus brasiliensis TaxID=27835 RepID=A0A0N4XUM9_NIPBR|nr:unnamed protein product [Nippostrongylus brasiliensis]